MYSVSQVTFEVAMDHLKALHPIFILLPCFQLHTDWKFSVSDAAHGRRTLSHTPCNGFPVF